MNSVRVILLALLFSFNKLASCTAESGADGSDIFRHMWSPNSKENALLLDELNTVEEEIRVERQFIGNMDRILKEMKTLTGLVKDFSVGDVNLDELQRHKIVLDRSYERKRAELQAEERKMEALWFDNDFRASFELILRNKLLEPNHRIVSNQFLGPAVAIKDRIIRAEQTKAEAIVDALRAMNNRADRIDGLFSQTNFYEPSQDYLELFNYSPDHDKMIRVFEARQAKKNELTNGIREMKTMARVNGAVDGNEDWKMRTFGFGGGGERLDSSVTVSNPILAPKIMRSSLALRPHEPAHSPDISEDKLMVKYAKYAQSIYAHVSKTTARPKTVMEDIIDALRLG